MNAKENLELANIERLPHENMEFYNRISMFESFKKDMWDKNLTNFAEITKTFTHLLIVEDDQEISVTKLKHQINEYLREQL
jgi:hypothetical protein